MSRRRAGLTRREFLAGAAAVLVLPRLLPHALSASPPAPAALPLLAVAQGPDPASITVAAVEKLGGMGAFVRRGARVVLKPNIGWDRTVEQGANTHPAVVRALCQMCLEAGAREVLIFDRTCNDARRCYVTSGMEEMISRLGDARVRLTFVLEDRFRTLEIPRGAVLQRWPVYSEALDADVLINVPVAKHHGIGILTLGMKNLMGIAGGNRGSFHSDIGQKLADLSTAVRPALTVLDATRIMLRNGPTGGRLEDVKVLNRVAASADPVALDAYGASLFGLTPDQVPSIAEGHRAGLGEMDLARIDKREIGW